MKKTLYMKRGFTIIEVVFGIAIFGMIVLSFSTVQNSMANHKLKVEKNEMFYSAVNKEITNLYANGWDYENKTIETPIGKIEVSLIEKESSAHKTKMAELSFRYDEVKRDFIIERSEYENE